MQRQYDMMTELTVCWTHTDTILEN